MFFFLFQQNEYENKAFEKEITGPNDVSVSVVDNIRKKVIVLASPVRKTNRLIGFDSSISRSITFSCSEHFYEPTMDHTTLRSNLHKYQFMGISY